MLAKKAIVLGVTGSIAAYKAADLASKLVQAGAEVDVVMTAAAIEFVSPLTFQSLTHRPVFTDMFEPRTAFAIEHVGLAQKAEAVLIAPATANTIARIVNGMADNLLTSLVLATRAPLIVAPAMDAFMYDNPLTRRNVARLREMGATVIEPGFGHLASGLVGQGRLADNELILGTLRQVLGRRGDLAGRGIVVTAGGTQEPIDPVRHISNRSSGKMGYAVAEAARDRGARVVLISGPVSLPAPVGIEMRRVQTALDMQKALLDAVRAPDMAALVMSAAVADYRVKVQAEHKIKRAKQEEMSIELVRNPDIVAGVSGDFVKVGFAAESDDLIENAAAKLKSKGLDLIVANDITAADSGFDVDTNRVVFIDRRGAPEHLPLMLKSEVAHRLLDRVVRLLAERSKG